MVRPSLDPSSSLKRARPDSAPLSRTDLYPRQHCPAGPHDPRTVGDRRDPVLRRAPPVCRPGRAADGRRPQAVREPGPQLPPRPGAHLPAARPGVRAPLHGPRHDDGVQREPGGARGGRLFAPRRRARVVVGPQVAVDHHGVERDRGVPQGVRRARLLAVGRPRVALRRLPPAGHLVRPCLCSLDSSFVPGSRADSLSLSCAQGGRLVHDLAADGQVPVQNDALGPRRPQLAGEQGERHGAVHHALRREPERQGAVQVRRRPVGPADLRRRVCAPGGVPHGDGAPQARHREAHLERPPHRHLPHVVRLALPCMPLFAAAFSSSRADARTPSLSSHLAGRRTRSSSSSTTLRRPSCTTRSWRASRPCTAS